MLVCLLAGVSVSPAEWAFSNVCGWIAGVFVAVLGMVHGMGGVVGVALVFGHLFTVLLLGSRVSAVCRDVVLCGIVALLERCASVVLECWSDGGL